METLIGTQMYPWVRAYVKELLAWAGTQSEKLFQYLLNLDVEPLWLAFCFGVIGTVYMVGSLFFSRAKRLQMQGHGALALGVYLLLLFDPLGATAYAMMGVRNTLFMQRGKKTWADGWFLPSIFVVIGIAMTAWSWKSIYSILPMTAGALGTCGAWLNNEAATRVLLLLASLAWVIYSVNVDPVQYLNVIARSITTVAAFVALCIVLLQHEQKNAAIPA